MEGSGQQTGGKCSYTTPCKYIGNADIHPVIIGLLLYTITICTTSNDCSDQPSVCANCSYMCNDRNTNMLPDLQFPENTHKATGVHSKQVHLCSQYYHYCCGLGSDGFVCHIGLHCVIVLQILITNWLGPPTSSSQNTSTHKATICHGQLMVLYVILVYTSCVIVL